MQSKAFQKALTENENTREKTTKKFEELRKQCPEYVAKHQECKPHLRVEKFMQALTRMSGLMKDTNSDENPLLQGAALSLDFF